jgi:hypothetical protein
MDNLAVAIDAHATTYTVLDFLRWQKDGTLDLRPPFQRKSVWRPTLKSSLVDSLLRGYPIPALFLQDKTNAATLTRQLVVVDGQQRLRTLIGYIDSTALADFGPRDDFGILRVHDSVRANFRFNDLDERDRDQILNSRLNVYTVGSSVTDRELLEIFRRMNTFGAKLNAQELRNAEYSGVFKEFIYRFSAETLDRWLDWGLFNRQGIAEMRDAEFTSDLVLLLIRGRGPTTKTILDKAYNDHEDSFPQLDAVSRRLSRIRDDLDTLFDGEALRAFRSRMWTYTLVDMLNQRRYRDPIGARGSVGAKPKRIDLERLRSQLEILGSSVATGQIPPDVLTATRGAANDAKSRQARYDFITAQTT